MTVCVQFEFRDCWQVVYYDILVCDMTKADFVVTVNELVEQCPSIPDGQRKSRSAP